MLDAYQVCYCVSRHLKNGCCSSSSPECKSMDSIDRISYYLDKILAANKWVVDDNLNFLSPQLWTCNSPELSSTDYRTWRVVNKLSQRPVLQCSNTTFEWKMRFLCFCVLPGSAETLVRWGGKIQHNLILSNISARNYQHRVMYQYVKVTARKISTFLGHVQWQQKVFS